MIEEREEKEKRKGSRENGPEVVSDYVSTIG